MKRIIDTYLQEWKSSDYRKPLLLRGARQVGKTYATRKFGSTFDSFVEINFEYENVKIDILDKEEQSKKQGLMSLAANTVIKGNNKK